MRKIFVTGIGTDVGKTVVSAILSEALQADYWKPIQTGSYFATDAQKVQKWISNPKTRCHAETYLLKQYMSPHAAAEIDGITIDMNNINLPATDNTLIIEGAGGLMVPLNRKELMIDMIQKFDCEVVLVIQNYLGSINHSLLSIDAMKNRNMKILGIVFNGAPHQLSKDIILEYSGLKCLGWILKENEVTQQMISNYAKEFSSI